MKSKQTQTLTPKPSEIDTTSSIEKGSQFAAPETIAWSRTGADSTKTNLASALAKAQAECQNVVMNKTNPHFRSRYADLAAVRDAIIPIFSKHGLSLIQCPNVDNDIGFHLENRLIHSSGEEMVWKFPLPGDVSKMQSIGSAISYARRYSYAAIAAVASEEDDDGNAATTTNGGGRSGPDGKPTPSGGPTPGGGIVL